MGYLQDIHDYAHQHLKKASHRMKTLYSHLSNSAGYQKGENVWLSRPTRTKRKSPKLQSSWEGTYRLVIWMNDVLYRIQRKSRTKMTLVHLVLLEPYQGTTQDERP